MTSMLKITLLIKGGHNLWVVERGKMKIGHVLWVVERDKAVKACPSNKALSIGTAGSMTPVDMWTIKIASIKNGVREHWEIRRLQSHRWRFVDIDDFITINVHAQLLILRCSWRLINKGPFWPVMDKHGRAGFYCINFGK